MTLQESCYEQNCAVLRQYCPATARKLDEHRDRFTVRIDRMQAGEMALFIQDGQAWRLFHHPDKYRKLTLVNDLKEYIINIQKAGRTGFTSFGLDAGVRGFLLFEKTDACCPLFFVERYPEILRALLGTLDYRALIRSERVFFFLGDTAASEVVSMLRGEYSMYFPVVGAAFCRPEDKDFYDAASSRIAQEISALASENETRKDSVCAYYRNLDTNGIRASFAPEKWGALKILGEAHAGSVFIQYAMRDCMQAFAQLGCSGRIMRSASGVLTSAYVFGVLHDFLPHLWFRINHVAKEAGFVHDSLIRVTWVQDHAPFIFDPAVKAEDKIGRYDQLLVMTRHFMEELAGIGFPPDRLHYFYFAANPELYHPMELSPEDMRRYASDVSFICNAPEVESAVRLVGREAFETLRHRMAESCRYYPEDFRGFWKELADSGTGDKGVSMDMLLSYVWPAVSALALRIPYMECIRDMNVALYGARWDQYPSLKHMARGIAENGTETCKICNASKIVINLHSSSNNHPRVFDTVASGGFLLTKLTPEDEKPGGIGDVFEIGKEIEAFRTEQEMREKIGYYLKHDDERRQIARRGCQRLMREHTYAHRMRQVLSLVHQGLSQ